MPELHIRRRCDLDPSGSCLLVAGSSTVTVGSQNFRTLSTRQIAFFMAERPMPAMLLRHSASVCRRYRSWPHWQLNRYGLRRTKPRNTTSWRMVRRANNMCHRTLASNSNGRLRQAALYLVLHEFCPLAGDYFPGYTRLPPAATSRPSPAPPHHVVYRWHSTVR